ncbi:hypothetical protein CEXT_713981 [Caerostris extrusa]|uniref:Uncharacterized protein n=1 Tax=Caerostris extrusa TaxID=172846 RepID=A0AAV4N728_CAEEX|nr:hypothetical protein CEXT_713981 [Caerostris extrusa]
MCATEDSTPHLTQKAEAVRVFQWHLFCGESHPSGEKVGRRGALPPQTTFSSTSVPPLFLTPTLLQTSSIDHAENFCAVAVAS